MKRRRDRAHRCTGCRMHLSLCICSLIPRLETRTHLTLIIHQTELGKTTNTGRLACQSLPNSRVLVRGAGHAPDLAGMPLYPDGHRPLLLFPAADAHPLHALDADARASLLGRKPPALIVLDGTWSQASRARRRIAALDGIPAVTVDTSQPGNYRLRTAPQPGQLSTLESIARALEHLEPDGAAVRAQLEILMATMVERTLWSQGKLRAAEVTGGIPTGAQMDKPWLVSSDS